MQAPQSLVLGVQQSAQAIFYKAEFIGSLRRQAGRQAALRGERDTGPQIGQALHHAPAQDKSAERRAQPQAERRIPQPGRAVGVGQGVEAQHAKQTCTGQTRKPDDGDAQSILPKHRG